MVKPEEAVTLVESLKASVTKKYDDAIQNDKGKIEKNHNEALRFLARLGMTSGMTPHPSAVG